jgi:L-amino acid N-acyltransferase YncA
MTERFAEEVLQADSLHAFIHPQNESSIAFIKAIGYEKMDQPGEDGVLVWQKNLKKDRI